MAAEDAPPLLREGSTFATRYRIGSRLGRGGMGEVYSAHDVELDEPVALKLVIVGSELRDPASAVQSFRSEVRLARRVSHPNVIRIHDLGQAEGQHYLTMELVRGLDLRALLLQRVMLPPEEAAAIGLQIAEGLAAAHAADVVHRDLKPGNILVAEGGRVKITDFGIARLVAAGKAAEQTDVSGTPAYMAPEQSAGASITDRVDVYALGLILHELMNGLRGRAPHAIPSEDPKARAMRALVGDCLSATAETRPSAKEVIARLHNLSVPAGADVTYSLPRPSAAADTVSLGAAQHTPATVPQRAPKRLALIPFSAPPAQADIARALTSELADVLSRTRGLRVRTLREADAAEQSTLGLLNQVNADFAVEGRLSVVGGRIRVDAKVLDGRTGDQLFRERLEDDLEAAVQMQEALGGRIAESLRVGFSTFANAGLAGPEATALYLRARSRMLTYRIVGADGALQLLDQCLKLAPHFKPALAARAAAEARANFASASVSEGRELAAISQALAEAADIPETRVAAATIALHHAQYSDALKHLQSALLSAPSLGEAHLLIGLLQVESGRAEEGCESLRLAAELSPDNALGQASLGRVLALLGDEAGSQAWFQKLPKHLRSSIPVLAAICRVAAWSRNFDHLRSLAAQYQAAATSNLALVLGKVAERTLGEISSRQLDEVLAHMAHAQQPRIAATFHQLASEAEGIRDDVDSCLRHLKAVSELGVIDLLWLHRCPALSCIRSTPEYQRIEAEAAAAARAIWEN